MRSKRRGNSETEDRFGERPKAGASGRRSWFGLVLFLLAVQAGGSATAPLAAQAAGGDGAARGEASPPMVYEFNVGVPMGDGTRLSADIYRPASSERHPVLLVRTPYTKTSAAYLAQARFWTRHGYVLVVQDVRGRGDSDGSMSPILQEGPDGRDTTTWILRQPWSNGRIGTLGASYVAWTQLYAAAERSPGIGAMIPVAAPPDPYRAVPLARGVVLPAAAAWLATLDGKTNQLLPEIDLLRAYSALPLADLDRRLGRELPLWREWIGHPANDGYWRARAYQDRLPSDIPMLHISGWYDDVLAGTTENFTRLTRTPENGSRPALQHLIIGPWGHAINAGRKLGAVDFGPDAVIDLEEVQRRWFDRWLKGIDNGVERRPPVSLFVMGRNQWVSENEWPIARTRYVRYFLHSGGKANSREGDGSLTPATPRHEPADSFRFDPADPVPYLLDGNWHQLGGPDDFSTVELRRDVLVYTGEAVREPLRVCGPVSVRLFASSSARDTDWTAKLLVVHPSGVSRRLADGIVRARFRHGHHRESLLTPGRVERYDIDLWSTCIELERGHRLRLEIASSALGKYDVNQNSGGPIGHDRNGIIADQTVFHDRLRASYVLLPIVGERR